MIHSTRFAAKTIASDIHNASQTDLDFFYSTKIGHLFVVKKKNAHPHVVVCCILLFPCLDWRGIKSVVSSCDLFFIS